MDSIFAPDHVLSRMVTHSHALSRIILHTPISKFATCISLFNALKHFPTLYHVCSRLAMLD